MNGFDTYKFEFDYALSPNITVLLSGVAALEWETWKEDGERREWFNVDMCNIGYQCYLDPYDNKNMSEYFGITDCWDNCPGDTREEIEGKTIDSFKSDSAVER